MAFVSSLSTVDHEEPQCSFCQSYYHDDMSCPQKPSSSSPYEFPCCYCQLPYHMGKSCTYYETQRKLYDRLDSQRHALLIAIDSFGSSTDLEEELADIIMYMERVTKNMFDFKSRYDNSLDTNNSLVMHDFMTPSHSLPCTSSPSIECEIKPKEDDLTSGHKVNSFFKEFDVPLFDDSLLISNSLIDNAFTLTRHIPLDFIDSWPHDDHMFQDDVKHVSTPCLQNFSCHLTLNF